MNLKYGVLPLQKFVKVCKNVDQKRNFFKLREHEKYYMSKIDIKRTERAFNQALPVNKDLW